MMDRAQFQRMYWILNAVANRTRTRSQVRVQIPCTCTRFYLRRTEYRPSTTQFKFARTDCRTSTVCPLVFGHLVHLDFCCFINANRLSADSHTLTLTSHTTHIIRRKGHSYSFTRLVWWTGCPLSEVDHAIRNEPSTCVVKSADAILEKEGVVSIQETVRLRTHSIFNLAENLFSFSR